MAREKRKDSQDSPLGIVQERACLMLLSGLSGVAICKQLGLSQGTLSRWRRDKDFQIVLNKMKNDIYADVIAHLTGAALDAVGALRAILQSDAASPRDKIAAAQAILANLQLSPPYYPENFEESGPSWEDILAESLREL